MRVASVKVFGLAMIVVGAGVMCPHAAHLALLTSSILHWAPSSLGRSNWAVKWAAVLHASGYAGLLVQALLEVGEH